jgi:hypothetical protein
MDKIFEKITELLPQPFLFGLVVLGSVYFGIYYSKGYRNHTDALNDTTFKNLTVIIIAGTFLYAINSKTLTPPSFKPVVVVPLFDNDERNQFREALARQLEAKLNIQLRRSDTVMDVNSFLYDQDAARETAKRLGAVAAIFQPKVIVIEENKNVRVCFRLLLLPGTYKTYAMIPLEIPDTTLADLINALSGGPVVSDSTTDKVQSQLGGRVAALENQIREISRKIYLLDSLARPTQGNLRFPTYKRKYALVIGIDRHSDSGMPMLRFAVSDSSTMAELLKEEGFEVHFLSNELATREHVVSTLAEISTRADRDDLVLAYFAGNAIVSKDGRQEMLALMPYDVRLSDMRNLLLIKDVRTGMESSRALYKLLVVDTCNGTVGFTQEHSPESALPEASMGSVFQFLAGTQDNEVGFESSSLGGGGGVFTRALVKVLLMRNPQTPLAMSEVLQRVSMEMSTEMTALALGHIQRPQLVTLGQGEIFWPPQSTVSASP